MCPSKTWAELSLIIRPTKRDLLFTSLCPLSYPTLYTLCVIIDPRPPFRLQVLPVSNSAISHFTPGLRATGYSLSTTITSRETTEGESVECKHNEKKAPSPPVLTSRSFEYNAVLFEL
jgi:hypothetical protein